jgi:predicted nucleotidyltransferase
MTPRLVRMGRCYRCLHTWRMRRRHSTMCPRCKSRLYAVPDIRPVSLGDGEGIEQIIEPHRVRLLEIGREAGIEGLWVFGSVRRKEARRSSDVDLLVTWKRPVSVLEVAGLVDRLSSELGRKVELVDRESLHWAMAPQIFTEAVPV